jgi:antitoxin CptB
VHRGQIQASADVDTPIDARLLNRLKWQCRRGLLENDLFIDRFFRQHGQQLSLRHAEGLQWLMDLADNELLDLLLRRSELPAGLNRPDVSEVLTLMRRPAPVSTIKGNTP